MAGKGALYESMQYSTKVEPVDFGGLALGFAKISEDKRKEAEQKQKERDQFQIETDRLYGEEVYSAFDNTGIDNLDIIGGKLKDGITAYSTTLNKLFSDGNLTMPQYQAKMNKIQSQSAKYRSFITQLGDYAQKVTDLGSDASEATRLILDRMNDLTQNATPVVDSEGNISFLSKSGETLTQTPFSQLDKIMDFRKQVDEKSIIRDMVATEGGLSQLFDESGAIKSTFLENGELTENHRTLLGQYTKTLDDTDLYDVAARAGINVELSPKELLKITNRGQVEQEVNKYLEKLALGEYARQDSLNYAKYQETMDKHNLTRAQINKAVKADQKYVKNNLPTGGGKRERDQYVFLQPHNVTEIQGAEQTLYSELMNLAGPTKQIDLTEAKISDYQTDEMGKHYATIEYSVQVERTPAEIRLNPSAKPTYVKKVAEIEIKDHDLIGRIRALGGLQTTQKDIYGNKTNGRQKVDY
jgi:hypothetical protein